MKLNQQERQEKGAIDCAQWEKHIMSDKKIQHKGTQ